MPEGYRKALRLMKQAEKFRRPVICFVDTPGAFCGIEAEERGQGAAIAENLIEMAGLTVPVLTVVTGEEEAAEHLPLPQEIRYGCWKMQFIPFFPRKDFPVFSGKTAARQKKLQKL